MQRVGNQPHLEPAGEQRRVCAAIAGKLVCSRTGGLGPSGDKEFLISLANLRAAREVSG